ncbi:MAG: hypothetical protein HQM09_18850 [Candidatus Riflebacteria bacterium]|nr:hypothetical protein [Candidatus Riflebacteria bacterium]
MKKLFLVTGIALALIFAPAASFAAKPAKDVVKEVAKDAVKDKAEVEKTGMVELKAKTGTEKHDTITLKVGTEVFKLLPGGDKGVWQKLEKMAGKEITIKGDLLPADATHPMAAIKVKSMIEAKGAAAAPATAAPVVVPAAPPTADTASAPAGK